MQGKREDWRYEGKPEGGLCGDLSPFNVGWQAVRGPGLSSDVAIPEGFAIATDATKKNLPIVSTTGEVTVPETAVWNIDATTEEICALEDRDFPIAKGVLVMPSGFGGWTCDNERLRISYRISGGTSLAGDIGDYCVWSIRDKDGHRDAFRLEQCAGCRIEDVTVYSTPMGCAFTEMDCASNTYLRCSLTRCPPEKDVQKRALRRLRSGNHDALNARRDYAGPTIDGCNFEYHCDDCVNVSGFYSVISKVEGNVVRILPYSSMLRIDEGDTCQVLTADGRYPPDVKVLKIEADGPVTEDELKKIEEWKFTHGIGRGLKRARSLMRRRWTCWRCARACRRMPWTSMP